MCISKGMVSGKRQAIDSAFIKANASLNSLVEKEVIADTRVYLDELSQNDEEKPVVTEQQKKMVDQHHNWQKRAYNTMPGHRAKEKPLDEEEGDRYRPKFLSNHTHYSPTDPDARISVKPGKPRQLNYSGQISVDTQSHVICGAMADHADNRDSMSLPAILARTIDNLKPHQIQVKEVLADTGYSSGDVLKTLEFQKITGYIPNFGQYKPEREGFTYDPVNNQYICSRGALLPYKKTYADAKGNVKHHYRASARNCKPCPLRSLCIGKSNEKTIEDTVDKPYYDRMHIRLQTQKAKRMKKLRQSTVEPVLGTLINFLNMKRVNTRGLQQANKHVLMAALAYNLKKYMNYIKGLKVAKLMEVDISAENQLFSSILNIFMVIFSPNRHNRILSQLRFNLL